MSSPDTTGPAAPARPTARVTALVWLNAISVTILVATELVGLSASLDWAVAGLFHLSDVIFYGLLAILLAASAAASWSLFRRALATERALLAPVPLPAGISPPDQA